MAKKKDSEPTPRKLTKEQLKKLKGGATKATRDLCCCNQTTSACGGTRSGCSRGNATLF